MPGVSRGTRPALADRKRLSMFAQGFTGIQNRINRAIVGSDWYRGFRDTDAANRLASFGEQFEAMVRAATGLPPLTSPRAPAPPSAQPWPLLPIVLLIGSGLAIAWYFYKGR